MSKKKEKEKKMKSFKEKEDGFPAGATPQRERERERGREGELLHVLSLQCSLCQSVRPGSSPVSLPLLPPLLLSFQLFTLYMCKQETEFMLQHVDMFPVDRLCLCRHSAV